MRTIGYLCLVFGMAYGFQLAVVLEKIVTKHYVGAWIGGGIVVLGMSVTCWLLHVMSKECRHGRL